MSALHGIHLIQYRFDVLIILRLDEVIKIIVPFYSLWRNMLYTGDMNKQPKAMQEIAGYMTVGKAAELLGVTMRQVQLLIADDKLTAILLGDKKPIWLLDKDSVMQRVDNPPRRGRPAGAKDMQPRKPKKSAAPESQQGGDESGRPATEPDK